MIEKLLEKIGIPQKLAYYVTSVALAVGVAMLRAKYPGIQLPDPDLILAGGGLVIGAHAVTDVIKSAPRQPSLTGQAPTLPPFTMTPETAEKLGLAPK